MKRSRFGEQQIAFILHQAEEVCRDDLGLSGRIQRCTQHPDNVWSLHGMWSVCGDEERQKNTPDSARNSMTR
jgi:hypothetical protein